MIEAPQLLADLTRQLERLEDDLRQRLFDPATEVPELKAGLQAEWQAARTADRTAETFESWADQVITQAGVHWLLSCVFIRFIEDNGLVERPWLGGTPESGRLALARDRHEAYFRAHPTLSDREFLLAAFVDAGTLPGLQTFFDAAHNPVFRLPISGDAAMALRQFWQQVDPNTGTLVHDFSDPVWNTRFLGNLYERLSEETRKRYALLQTPEFVESFILDRTLTPAIREFGFRDVRMIDPTCGSGHFLLSGFYRLVDEWARAEPGRNRRDIAQKALDAVAGVDLNPFAVAIARFRLWVAALQVSGVQRLAEAPNFKLNVAIGDSLLHGRRFGLPFLPVQRYTDTGLRKRAQWEDTWALQRREDAGQDVGKIPVPPKYQSKDFLKTEVWRLRGGLDVPKERWVSYPGCERGADGSLLIAWAGWNHLQQATALAAHHLDMRDNEGWPRERLQPLLAGLLELLPWLKQWHNEVDPTFGERMGDFYEGFVNDQARELGFTVADLRGWKPVAAPARRGRPRQNRL